MLPGTKGTLSCVLPRTMVPRDGAAGRAAKLALIPISIGGIGCVSVAVLDDGVPPVDSVHLSKT